MNYQQFATYSNSLDKIVQGLLYEAGHEFVSGSLSLGHLYGSFLIHGKVKSGKEYVATLKIDSDGSIVNIHLNCGGKSSDWLYSPESEIQFTKG